MYRFDLPTGKSLDDYAYRVQVSYLVGPATIAKNNGARAIRWYGNYSVATVKGLDLLDANQPNIDFNKEDDPDWPGNLAVANFNTLGNGDYILDQLAASTTIGAAAGNLGISIKPYEWFTLTYKIDKTGSPNGSFKDANLPKTSAPNGPLYFGIGIPDGGDGGNTHYIRDVTLVGTSSTESLKATPLYVKKGSTVYPAFVGYASTSGADGVKEYYRKNCDGSQPEPVVID